MSTNLRSQNISYRIEGAIEAFCRRRYNRISAQGNLLSVALGGTQAVWSGVGSPVRGHCYGPSGQGRGKDGSTNWPPAWKWPPSCSSPLRSLLHLWQQSAWHIVCQYLFSKSTKVQIRKQIHERRHLDLFRMSDYTKLDSWANLILVYKKLSIIHMQGQACMKNRENLGRPSDTLVK